MKIGFSILALIGLLGCGQTFSAERLAPIVPTFVENYCIDCHDNDVTKGDRNFLPLLTDPNRLEQSLMLEEILDQLDLGEMPPEKKNVTQPPDQERRAVTAEIRRYLLALRASTIPDDTPLRRLTRYEYKNTIRDLLGIDPEINDATSEFPEDQKHDGFATVGGSQVISEHQLGLYLNSARSYLDQALVFGLERPQTKSFKIEPSEFTTSTTGGTQVAYRALALDGSHVDIAHGEPADRRPNAPKSLLAGLPSAGMYRIRVRATGVGRLDHGYDPEVLKVDTSQPIKLGVWFATTRKSLEKTTTRGRNLVEVFALKDGEPDSFETSVWMPKGAVPFFNWINGSGAAKGPLSRVVREYHPEADRLSMTEVDAMRERGEAITDEEVEKHNNSLVTVASVYRGPRMRLFDIEIEGPLVDAWPPASHTSLVGTTTDAGEVDIPHSMRQLAERAFRRPVTEREIAHHIAFVYQAIAAGDREVEAIKSGFSALLSSPKFLYLDEGDPKQRANLSPYQLASRLSYFLWSTMPDEALMNAAASGRLVAYKDIIAQVERMLDDPKAEAFSRHFTDGWLRLDKLGKMPPGPKQFPTYLKRRLEDAMRTETQMLVSHLVRENRPISDFLDADYTFINDNLAEHYGVPGVNGERFRKVSLPPEVRRRGLTGHASVLTASANGVETSPVLRGIWVLESLLGTPPPPPPPDVPPIEPDTRGTLTIRDQLAKHREVAACADCHNKIDPWGFALESYGPIGGLRTRYPKSGNRGKGPVIDLSASLPSGKSIADEVELRAALLDRKDMFLKNLLHQLLTYGTGREPQLVDHAELEKLEEQVKRRGYGMRDLVTLAAASKAFRRR
jgi:hypothetical protein